MKCGNLVLLAWNLGSLTLAAPAATYTQTLSQNNYANPPGGAFTLTFTSVPAPTAGGTLRVRASGDLDGANEFLDVSMEGIQFGPLFNNNPDDDRFNNAVSDAGLLDSPVSSTANVTFAEFQNVSANGSIAVTIAPSANVAEAAFIQVTLTYEIAATGACCIASPEGCQDLTSGDCGLQGGTYAGDGTSCATFVCFPKGACCLPDGNCSGDQVTPQACTGLNGTFQGNGSTCAGSDCRIKGACCVPNVGCSQQVLSDCTTLGGTYKGDNTPCGGDDDVDGVANTCDLCPGTIAGVTVDASGCPPAIPGDFDRDGDVDSTDFGSFITCAGRAAVPRPPNCGAKDFNSDGDVDPNDFGVFQRCYSGEMIPGNPACAN